MTDFELTDGERSHPLWQRLYAHLVESAADARARNDDPALSERETAVLRGRIYALKSLIALDTPRPIIYT